MIRTALDSDDLNVFTSNTDFVLTYSDLVTHPDAFAAHYPTQQVVYIDRGLGDPGDKATIADVETGALTPAHLNDWYNAKTAARLPFLTFYANRSNLAACMAQQAAHRMFKWVATLDGTMHINGYSPLHGPDLVQILDSDHLGIHADFSVVLTEKWRPASSPVDVARALTDVHNAINAATSSLASMHAVEAYVISTE